MSEILIPNVDLPKKEEDATYLRIDSYGHVFQYDHRTIEMRTIAKVVELPPHGDLVEKTEISKGLLIENSKGEKFFAVKVEDYNKMPVVIPASKETNNECK